MRHTAKSAHLPGSSEPMSSRRSTAAPPRVPSRIASRAVIAVPPPRPRATSSACFTSRNRSPRSFDAVPSTPRPTRIPASSMSRTGATPAPSRRFEVGQWATPVPVDANWAMSASERWTQWAHQTSSASQPSRSRYSTGPAAVELDAVRLLLERLREVGVEGQPEPAGERGRLLHQPSRDRERRARRHRELDACSRAGLVQQRRKALRLGEHGVELLDELVGRKAAVGLAEIHRAARGDDPHADLARRLHLGLDQPLAALREHVVVVEHGRAARQRELGEAGARRGVLRLGVDPRPHRDTARAAR